MRISKKREQALYDAIHEEIMNLRIEIQGLKKDEPRFFTFDWIDSKLFTLEQTIWAGQKKVLN